MKSMYVRFVRFVYGPGSYVTANVGPVTLCDGPAQESGVVDEVDVLCVIRMCIGVTFGCDLCTMRVM